MGKVSYYENLGNGIRVNKANFEEGNYVEILDEGVKLKREGKYNEAKEKYIQAIKKDSKNSTAYYNLGKLLYILGDFESSTRAYKTAFELGSDPYYVLNHLGHSLLDHELRSSEYEYVILSYEKGIDPYSLEKYFFEFGKFPKLPEENLLIEYKEMCVDAAKKYLGID